MAFSCQGCDAICDWETREPAPDAVEVKTVGSRYCNRPECIRAEQLACACAQCRAGVVHHRETQPAPELAVPCPICNARVGERCASLINASKYLDVAHARRWVALERKVST